jgi:very-short-patch-repair endonuclease
MAIPSSTYPSLRLEGGLFSPDLIEALNAADLPGQKPPDFRLPPGRGLTGEIAAAFNDARALWQVFQNRLERLPADDPATSATREFWVIPFLRLLGYDLRFNPRALEVDGAPFPISHALGADQSQDHAGAEAPVPVHIVGYRQELGRVAPAARPRLSPHALVQEYLNRSEALWGLVTNGRTLRLLRNSTFVRRQAYVEFDLAAIFADEGRFADFVLLYRLLHRTRLPSDGRAPADCLLETYYQQAVEQGGRVRERLRDGVEQAIVIMANGFLRHPASVALRATLQTWRGEGATASSSPSEAVHAERSQREGEGADALYRQLLRLVYRLLFLLTAEERGLMGGDPLYRDHYGISRLRRLCTRRASYTDHDDLWLSLRALWLVLTDERMARLLDAPPLNGELFAHQELDDASIANRDLLRAFWHLAFYREGDAPPRRVNYAALDTEELGSVYESLLDYHPAITFDTRGLPTFVLTFGSERKATGSYYTPPSLVNELVQSALAPVLEERVRPCRTAREKEAALLALNVLDPACGSGHFLLAAARRLGKELARIRTGEDEPAPERVREAIRDVVAHCIYGVDRNPLAVELARVALWLESHAEGKPLTFLDHRIKCGDSLVGVLDLEALREGLPDDAFAPVVGDDRKLAANLKRRNRTEREGQLTLFDAPIDHDLSPLAETARRIETIRDDTPDQVHRKRATYEAWRTDPHLRRLSNACDLWTAAFFQVLAPHPRPTAPDAPASPAQNPEMIITTDAIRRAFAGQPIAAHLLGEAQALAAEHRFFHWPLEFPEVFAFHPQPHQGGTASGGFDVVLGNPPWERIKLQEEEFFAVRDPQIARAANAAARKRLIAALPQTNLALWEAYQRALHAAESASRFLRGSGQYPLTGRGDINTYSVFAERVRSLLNVRGRAGIIVPTGIATDATNQFFFADLVEKGQLASLFDFENRQRLFPAVDSRMKFCLLTLTGSRTQTDATTFTFFATRTEHLRDPRRAFRLSATDIARINPNTRTLPVFRTRQDADLTRAIYQRVPVLVNENSPPSPKALGEGGQGGEGNPWGVRFMAMFHMSNDSHLFRTRAELEKQGYRLVGNVFVPSPPNPLSHAVGEGGWPSPPNPLSHAVGEGGWPSPPNPLSHAVGEGGEPSPPSPLSHAAGEGGEPSPPSPLSHAAGEGGEPSPPSPLSHAAGEGGRIAAPDLSSRAAGEGEYKLPRASRELIARARQLRREATTAESLLWELLRDRRLLGRKFRRQHPIGQFIADFFCDDARLIIEIDGAVHREPTQQERDRLREEILREHGFAMLRFTNEQIFDHTEQVLQEIAAYVTAHSYEHPSPLSPPLPKPGERGPGGEGRYLPLYEAKMIWHYDHRYGTYEGVRDRSSTQLPTPNERQHADPHFVVQPWYWVRAEEVAARLGEWQRGWLLGFRRIARATDERTAIFTLIPATGAGDNVFLLFPDTNSVLTATLTGNLISLPFDWVVRQKLAGVNMNFFYVEQFPVLPPDAYTPEDLRFIVPRVLELTCTAWDLKPFADDVWNEADDGLRAAIHAAWDANRIATGGHEGRLPSWISAYPEIETNPQKGIPFLPFRWDEDRRAVLRAELDAYYARLYGLTRKQLRYILDPADLTERELADILDPWEEVRDPLDPAGYAARVAASTFPGETFRVLKEKELRQFGEYRTRRLVLEAWENLERH